MQTITTYLPNFVPCDTPETRKVKQDEAFVAWAIANGYDERSAWYALGCIDNGGESKLYDSYKHSLQCAAWLRDMGCGDIVNYK